METLPAAQEIETLIYTYCNLVFHTIGMIHVYLLLTFSYTMLYWKEPSCEWHNEVSFATPA